MTQFCDHHGYGGRANAHEELPSLLGDLMVAEGLHLIHSLASVQLTLNMIILGVSWNFAI